MVTINSRKLCSERFRVYISQLATKFMAFKWSTFCAISVKALDIWCRRKLFVMMEINTTTFCIRDELTNVLNGVFLWSRIFHAVDTISEIKINKLNLFMFIENWDSSSISLMSGEDIWWIIFEKQIANQHETCTIIKSSTALPQFWWDYDVCKHLNNNRLSPYTDGALLSVSYTKIGSLHGNKVSTLTTHRMGPQ